MTELPAIETLLPHDNPMILVDRALSIGATSIHSQVDIDKHLMFFNSETKTVPAYVGIEFMAQSIAAWSGYQALQKGQQPPIGFLLGSRRYATECDQFTQGQTLDIFADQVMEDNGMAVFSGRIEYQGNTIAQCQLNVYVPTQEKLQEMKIRSHV
ncbi:hotdog family protein [Vibrio diazotrophicus]|uniref:hotdog family protein n=1 Tax=Vibrio diazotrophicus TaxID=685 RepID=UPI0005A63EF2|nr:hotdog family protein [Vibrio diazotrophicus]